MQKNYFTSVLVMLSFIFSSTIFASLSSEPEKCPSTSALISVGIEAVEKGLCNGWYGVVFANQYDTKNAWSMLMVANTPPLCGIPANDEIEARKKMLSELTTLQYIGGPDPINNNDVWGCAYMGDHISVYTYTPPLTVSSLMRMVSKV